MATLYFCWRDGGILLRTETVVPRKGSIIYNRKKLTKRLKYPLPPGFRNIGNELKVREVNNHIICSKLAYST